MGEPSGVVVVPVGYNPSDRLRALELDASDYLLVSLSALPSPLADLQLDANDHLLVAFQTPAKGLVGDHAWISAAWQKQPIMQGYSDTLRLTLSNTALAAGTNSLIVATVPAGEIWVIENISVRYVGTVTGVSIGAYFDEGGTLYVIYLISPPVTNAQYDRQGSWTLKPGDILRLFITGATANDDAHIQAVGRRIDIDQ